MTALTLDDAARVWIAEWREKLNRALYERVDNPSPWKRRAYNHLVCVYRRDLIDLYREAQQERTK